MNPDKNLVIFGQNLKHYRKLYGFSQTDLSIRTGISKRSISLYERGMMNPSLYTCGVLADALQISITELLMIKEEHEGWLFNGGRKEF